ncbi:MAG: 50S ribosomal protein L11 methyltransferase [Candidatus Caldatribacteriaceae bacterium]
MKRTWIKVTFVLREGVKEAFFMWLSGYPTSGAWEVDEKTIVVYSRQLFVEVPSSLIEKWWQEEEEEEEWGKNWKKYFRAIRIGENLVVRPPWARKSSAALEVVIYPAYAFGTGHHPTTYGCLYFIREYFRKGWSFLDLGTGSGILSILALKMGAKRVCAVDIDPLAIEEMERNLQLNDLEMSRVERIVGEIDMVQGRFHLVAANVGPHFHLENLPTMKELLEKGGFVILSGFEEHDATPIVEKTRKVGLSILKTQVFSSWVSMVCQG